MTAFEWVTVLLPLLVAVHNVDEYARYDDFVRAYHTKFLAKQVSRPAMRNALIAVTLFVAAIAGLAYIHKGGIYVALCMVENTSKRILLVIRRSFQLASDERPRHKIKLQNGGCRCGTAHAAQRRRGRTHCGDFYRHADAVDERARVPEGVPRSAPGGVQPVDREAPAGNFGSGHDPDQAAVGRQHPGIGPSSGGGFDPQPRSQGHRDRGH